MSEEKDIGGKIETGGIQVMSPPDHDEFYDPSKESALTRAGLTLESFKRAPGVTK
jgi:amino acid transporter